MRLISTKLYSFSLGFIQSFSLLLTGLLFVSAFLFTCYAQDMETQRVLTKWDNPFISLLGMAVFLAFIWCLVRRLPDKLLFLLILLWCLCAGGALILFGKTVPAADAMSVYSAAQALAEGDLSVIHPTDSYLSYYPQQVGLMAFFEALIHIWNLFSTGLPAYHFIKCFYVLLSCVIVLFQYKTARILFPNGQAGRICLLLMGANLPFLMYTSFVYGEIPSYAAASAGFYLLLCLLQKKGGSPDRNRKFFLGVGAAASLCISVMLRKNSLILVIAALILLFLEGLKARRKGLLFLALLCALSSFGILPLTQKVYELRSGSYLKEGVPAISYLAMGMQESSRGNGWYNGFNFNTYQETGMDKEASSKRSLGAIRERLDYFSEHPAYAVSFYMGKHLSQWADGTYASRQATLATFGGRQPFFDSLYVGGLSRYYLGYCNIFQNMLYGGSFLFCLAEISRQKSKSLTDYLGLIGVVGGFLFHIFWEANARYIFTYGLLLAPCSAQGISLTLEKLNHILQKIRRKTVQGGPQ
nr:hypothetical protein [uncultured Acetatifactor sp.]